MNIVVLDGYMLNPGDLSWDGLRKLGNVTVHERTAPEDVADRAAEADIVLTNKAILSADTIDRLPRLRYIGVMATGYNVVDIDAARAAGIVVTNVPGYSSASVAQLTFALLLELCSQVGKHHDAVQRGEWTASPDFAFTVAPLMELSGKTFGVVGMGEIGQAAARIALSFGMNVVASSRSRKPVDIGGPFMWLDMPELLASADVVSLHCPLTAETQRLIRRDTLALMKPTALLINTSRGGLVDEQDLADALNAGTIAGCGVDVLSSEPPSADNPLLHARNCIITPHIGWATKEARTRLMDITIHNVEAFLAGRAINIVSS